jgi:hypothetical protein
MTSFWDKVEQRQRVVVDRRTALRNLQLELWGWCDERPRDGAGNLLPTPPRQNGFSVVGGDLSASAVAAARWSKLATVPPPGQDGLFDGKVCSVCGKPGVNVYRLLHRMAASDYVHSDCDD